MTSGKLTLVARRYGHSHDVLDDAAVRWSLELVGEPAEGIDSAIFCVNSSFGPAVLKVPRCGGGEERAAEHLTAWGGCGTVELLARAGSIQLLRRLDPGTRLSVGWSLENDDQRMGVLAGLAETLFSLRAPSDAPDAYAWAVSLLGRRRPEAVPRATWNEAVTLYRQSAERQGATALLHGDLHHDNVLRDASVGWRAIDPKGVIAEAEFELGCALRNPIDQVELITRPEVIRRRLDLLTHGFRMNRERLVSWACSQAVLAAAWACEDGQDPRPWLCVADAYKRELQV